MKYKHAFWIALPFAVIGLGKAIHKFKEHQGSGSCCDHKHHHLLKFLSWRLGLSPEQQSSLHKVFQQSREALEPLMAKKKQLHETLLKAFSQDTFDSDEILRSIDGKVFENVKSTIVSVLAQAHKILTPLQREKVRGHLSGCLAHCHHWC
jgi:Spy/CpxP family protein refolding chaperone